MPDEQNIIDIRRLNFSRAQKIIYNDVSLTMARGKITAIMGPSGTGKTTLLRLISGQIKPNSGEVLVDDLNVAKLNRKQLSALRRRMGFLFQSGGLFTDLDVFENVAFPLREHTKLSEDMIHDLVLLMLQAVGLRGAAHLRVEELSGGMARRVALARAIVLGPQLMLYDEPFSGQDPIARGVVLKLIRQLNDALHLSSIVVSHDVTEASQIADYIYILGGGKIIGAGTPEELFKNETEPVKQFVQGLPDGSIAFDYPAPPLQEELNL
jgi:phospholipid/cholesterol/gamma-HCH transport system ATP-binding protein